jgi:hypothetical protein
VKVLLDEDIPHKLRGRLSDHEVSTVAYLAWDGMKNGELLKAAEEAGFDLLITSDKGFPHQQNISSWRLAVVVLSAQDWNIIKDHVPKIAAAIDAATPGSFTRVDVGRFSRTRNPKGPALG